MVSSLSDKPGWIFPMTLSAGDRMGPYQIVERIGAGGMGEVYRAVDSTGWGAMWL